MESSSSKPAATIESILSPSEYAEYVRICQQPLNLRLSLNDTSDERDIKIVSCRQTVSGDFRVLSALKAMMKMVDRVVVEDEENAWHATLLSRLSGRPLSEIQ